MRVHKRTLIAAWSSLLLLASLAAQAQPAPAGGGPAIYTCTDARGRTLTADRPIADCIDREQRELSPSGSTRRRIAPTYTAREQAERDEHARQAQIQVARQNEERRRERALLIRYPNATAHDRERTEALVQIDAVIKAARQRLTELGDERKKVDDELEFYKGDASKAPASVRRKLDDNAQSVAVQNRFIGEQDDEKRRVNARFDEERTRLRQLWTVDAGGAAK